MPRPGKLANSEEGKVQKEARVKRQVQHTVPYLPVIFDLPEQQASGFSARFYVH